MLIIKVSTQLWTESCFSPPPLSPSFCLPCRNVWLTMLQAAMESLGYLWNTISVLSWWQLLKSICPSGSFLWDSVVLLEESFQQQVKIDSFFCLISKSVADTEIKMLLLKRSKKYAHFHVLIKWRIYTLRLHSKPPKLIA